MNRLLLRYTEINSYVRSFQADCRAYIQLQLLHRLKRRHAYAEQSIRVVHMKNWDNMHKQLQLHYAKDITYLKREIATLSAFNLI